MKKVYIIAMVVAAVFIIALGLLYNGIITRDEAKNVTWAEVENQMQRRAELIPDLVNTVKGYAAHEKTVLEDVTKARSQWDAAKTVGGKISANEGIDTALGRLLVVVENYPNLKADSTFLKLMDELAGTANRIAVARMRYNNAVMDYNVTVRGFPSNVIARIFGYEICKDYFKAEQSAKVRPEVKF